MIEFMHFDNDVFVFTKYFTNVCYTHIGYNIIDEIKIFLKNYYVNFHNFGMIVIRKEK